MVGTSLTERWSVAFFTSNTVDDHYTWVQVGLQPRQSRLDLIEWVLGWSLETGLYVEGYNGTNFLHEDMPENWEIV